jgi:hypothetical protein
VIPCAGDRPRGRLSVDELYEAAAALDGVPSPDGQRPVDLAPLVVLLASTQIGTDPTDLVAYTELPEEIVLEYARRLWANRVWVGGSYSPNSSTTLLMHALVADGLIERRQE